MMKRFFDIIASALALILLSPLFFIIAVAIKICDGGPIFYAQIRVGKGFVPFKIYKFRTMVVGAEKIGSAITAKGDERVTKIGKLLRRWKLDELPQLMNVLKGDMSIVGPRPEDPKYVNIFKDDYRKILQVKPGITDYASLEYRHEEEVLAKYEDPEKAYVEFVLPRKIELSKKYIRERTILKDIALIIKTINKIILGSG